MNTYPNWQPVVAFGTPVRINGCCVYVNGIRGYAVEKDGMYLTGMDVLDVAAVTAILAHEREAGRAKDNVELEAKEAGRE